MPIGGAQETLFEQELLNENPTLVKRFYLPIGQNSKDFASAIDFDEVASLQNADTTSRAIRKTRPGYTLIANDVGATRIVGLGRFFIEGGTKYLLMVTDNDVYSWPASGNWTALTGFTPTADLLTNIVVAGNIAFFLNGTDNAYSTSNGTTLTDEGNTNTDVPKSRFGIYHQNMLIVSGNTTNKSYVWPSSVLAVQTFDRSGRVIKVADQDGDENTAMVDLSLTTTPGFIVFKGSSTFFVDTSAGGASVGSWGIIRIDPIHGCVGPRAAATVGSSRINGDCVFLSKEGTKYRLRSLQRTVNDAVGTGGILSAAIEDVLSDVNDTIMDDAIVFYFDERIFLCIPSGASSYLDTVCVLDLRNSDATSGKWKWSVWTGMNVGALATYEESSVENLYFGEGSADSKVYRALSGTTDNGTAIDFVEESRREDFGFPELDKIFQFVEVEVLGTDDGAEATIYAQVDGDGYSSLGTMDLVSSGPHLPIALPFQLVAQNKIRKIFQLDNLGIGRDIQIKVESSDRIELLGYTLMAFLEPLHLETRNQS